jgi:hypothetical protein
MHSSGFDTLVQKEIVNLTEIVKASNKSNSRISKIAIAISILATIFSSISVYYTMKDDANDTKWMEIQSIKLQQLIDAQNNTTKELGIKLDTLIMEPE